MSRMSRSSDAQISGGFSRYILALMSRRPAAHISQHVYTTRGCCWTCSYEGSVNKSDPSGFSARQCLSRSN
eukprot:4368275-Prorocentrum_lima.AAC.1